MIIRSASELSAFLDQELAWRKRELTTFRLLALRLRPHEQAAALRGGVCLLYAHWEGFIKLSATAYVNFVSRVGLHYRELSSNLLALSLRPRFREAGKARRDRLRIELTEFLLSAPQEPAEMPWRDAVDAEANLSAEVFRDIAAALGLDYAPYATKEPLIDARLLASRNKVAHGERVELAVDDYVDLHSNIVELLEMFRDDILNAAVLKKFLRQQVQNSTS